MTEAQRPVGIVLDTATAYAWTRQPPPAAIREAVELVLLGAERVGIPTGTPDRRPDAPDTSAVRLDPAALVPALVRVLPRAVVLVATTFQTAHPYLVARRVASLALLTGGRVGVVIGRDDPAAPEPTRHGSRFAADGTDLDAQHADGLAAVSALLTSYPTDALVFDHGHGVQAVVDGIRTVDHEGVFRIVGPLTTPTDPRTAPVLVTDERAAVGTRAAPPGGTTHPAADLALVDTPDGLALVAATDSSIRARFVSAGDLPDVHRASRSTVVPPDGRDPADAPRTARALLGVPPLGSTAARGEGRPAFPDHEAVTTGRAAGR